MKNASKENNFHYNKNLQQYANNLRKRMTKGEACMWKYILSNRKMKGYQFKRQRPVLNYIADFMCQDLLLIIEVDGFSHNFGEPELDVKRDENLKEIGFTTLRFSDWMVLNRIGEVQVMIEEWIEVNAIFPPPSPRQRGRK